MPQDTPYLDIINDKVLLRSLVKKKMPLDVELSARVPAANSCNFLEEYVSKIRAKDGVKVVSVTDCAEEICKDQNILQINFKKDSDAIELKDVSWQNIVLEGNFTEYPSKATEILSQKIIEFVEKSTTPVIVLLVLLKDKVLLNEELLLYIANLLRSTEKNGGYFGFKHNNIELFSKKNEIKDLITQYFL